MSQPKRYFFIGDLLPGQTRYPHHHFVLYDDYAALAAENERLRRVAEWHSKDTLPKEGVDVLCMSGNFMFVGWVDRHGIWQSSDDSRFVPDCWMPLPQAPAKEGDAK